MLYDRLMKHGRGRCTVQVFAIGKRLDRMRLPGKVGKDPGFDGRVVGDDKLHPRLWNESSTDQLGENLRHIVIEHFKRSIVILPDKISGLFQIWEMILRQVL